MLKNQGRRHQRHRPKINRAKLRHQTKANERSKHGGVQQLSKAQTSRDTQFQNERMDVFAPVKIVILRRVNQVEAGDPAKYA